MILFILSFVAGVLTILAPCTLPLLPVIVGSSVSGSSDPNDKKGNYSKAFTIAASLGISIILFTFVLKVSTLFINIPQTVWEVVSGVIIVIFGLVGLFPTIWEKVPFISAMNRSSNKMLAEGYKKKSFWGDVIIGASLGPVFSTCSPTYFVILATVLPQSFLLGLVDLIAYAVGLSGMLLLVAFLGQKLVNRIGTLSDSNGLFKRGLGALFIIIGLLVMFGVDKIIEAKLLSSGLFDITRVEQSLLSFNDKSNSGGGPSNDITFNQDATTSDPLINDQSMSSTTASSTNDQSTVVPTKPATSVIKTQSHGPKAPELVSPNGYINTGGQPITISQFKGKKVILLDIWTYSCINCQRTLPYVEAWYEKYKDMGLEVIGLHTPEFAFEKVQKNVEDAVKRLGITYPVVLDNEYQTWNAYGNQYWPRKYLINENGEIIYNHIGEGEYDITEKEIQKALAELNGGGNVPTGTTVPTNAISYTSDKVGSPETYFGSGRNVFLANGTPQQAGTQTLTFPDKSSMVSNKLYLEGTWNFTQEYAQNTGSAKVMFKYNTKNVYFVASSDKSQDSNKVVTVTVLKDGVKVNTVSISENKLYTLIEGSDYGEHTLELDIEGGGLDAFTFTFG